MKKSISPNLISVGAAMLAVLCVPAWAINKCTLADGKVVFQDASCNNSSTTEILNVRPASGRTASPPPTVAADGDGATIPKVQTEAQRIEARVKELQRDRNKQNYELVVVPGAYGAIAKQRKQCDADLAALQEKKGLAKNNLAGATWEGSISSEMNAVSLRCDTKARELKEELDVAKRECKELGGCK
nr:DUF4124 domain-containing protein [Rhodoferax sp.]